MKHPGLSKKEHNELGRYIRGLADKMWLSDWTFNLSYEEPGDASAGMSIECYYGRKGADIFVRSDQRERDLSEFRTTVVHELVHCHTAVMWDMVRNDLLQHLGQTAYDLFCDSFKRAMEYAVDGLAEVIAPQMPLIQWPGEPLVVKVP